MAHILVIDDDDAVRRSICVALRSAGHEVLEASDGDRGLKIFREKGPDLVICDIFMPGKEGLETVGAMLASRNDLNVIMISGGSGEMDFLRVAEMLGASHTLRKPFSAKELLDVVDACLKVPAKGAGK